MCPPLLQVLPCLHQHQDVVPEPFAAFQVPRPPTERKRGASGDVSLTSTTEQPLQVLLTSGCCNCAGDMTETAAQLGSLFLRRGVSHQYTSKQEKKRQRARKDNSRLLQTCRRGWIGDEDHAVAFA